MSFFKNVKSSICASLLCLSGFSGFAQMTVTPTSTGAALSAALGGPGVTISNPVLTCNSLSNGTFNAAAGTTVGTAGTPWGIPTGIVLSTGRVASAVGTAATLASNNMGFAGDPALATLAGATTFDACILEFDIIPTGDTIKFDYIFGSEEYNNSTCGPYNDAFAFFISGPGITGTANMALIPGTTIPVTVNTVNSGVPGPTYTLANCTSMGPGSPFTAYFNDNTGGTFLTMKGFTKVLTALHDVIPCNTYHLKIAIADAGNSIYDSEVFLKQGSISSHTVVSTAAVCAGSTITVTSSPAGGTWSSSNTAIATVDPSTGVATGVSAGTADLTYTTGAGCFSVVTATVHPIPTITGATSACIDATLAMTATPAGGTWSGGNPAIATITAAGVATGGTVGTVPVTYTSVAGCVVTGTFSVVNLAPITGVTTVCQGSTTNLANITTGGIWSSSTPAVAAVNASGVVSGVSAGTSNITYSLGGGCYSTATVTVTARPAPPVATAPQYCLGATAASLTATGTGLLWYTTPTGGSGTSLAPTPLTTIAAPTTYYVTQTVGGCESIRTPVTVTINPLPIVAITGPIAACKGQTVAYAAGAYPFAVTYQWTISADLTLTSGSTTTSSAISVVATAAGTRSILVEVTNTATGCIGYDTLDLVVTTPPDAVPYTPGDACLGDTIDLALVDHSMDAYTYTWTVDGVRMDASPNLSIVAHNSNSGGPYLITWNTPGIHIISIQSSAVSGGCASDPTFDTVKVHALPDAQFQLTSFKNPPCLEDSIFFAARTFNYANTYEWTPAHSFYNQGGPSIWGQVETLVSDVTLTVTDPFGCKATSVQRINADACCRVSFPSAFTPNGDGNNDLFRPIFEEQGRDITSTTTPLPSHHRFHTFRINNRWGQTVFETTNNYPQWDGKLNGVPQDMGVFYYVLKYDCGGATLVQTGDVTLIR